LLLQAQGSILGGRIWIDPKRNPPGELLQGRPVFSGDIEPTGVAEDIQIEMQRNPGYYKELIDQVVLSISN
jgi:uncharacterized protein